MRTRKLEGKISWSGKVVSVQPRIRMLRSFDERSHSYLGYTLQINGSVNEEEHTFTVAVGKAAQERQQFRFGDTVSGKAGPVEDPRLETAEYYKVSELRVLQRGAESEQMPPPWHGIPPALEIYRERGHRRLDAHTYEAKCASCLWGCRMPVVMVIDQWNPRKKQYRLETFCYGPKSCPFYKAGPTRKVPGRRGMSWEEEDWVDEEATSHRAMDD
ncbi:MAG TPA: hypothetical protein VEJ88_01595 [Dissulfurispiraceae bacterium]|nr:hypothetical protein [Dissulfurispiraceae bacterium]